MAVSRVLKAELPTRWSSEVDEITKRIVATEHPQRILIFGSVARGHSKVDSDLDILVIKLDTIGDSTSGILLHNYL